MNWSKTYPKLLLSATLVIRPLWCVTGCVVPTGIGSSCSATTCIDPSSLMAIPRDNTFAIAIQAVLGPSPGLKGLEAPVQSHLTSTVMTTVYNAAAAFHESALDSYARKELSDSRRRCDANASNMSVPQWMDHRQVTLSYCILWSMSEIITYNNPKGGAEVEMRALAQAWGLNFDICDTVDNCDDPSTPWGFCRLLIDESKDFISRDGWNKDGTLLADTNGIPYSDFRKKPYVPRNEPWKLGDKKKWQPLAEHDGNGHISYQEHVTPHIGETARTIYLGNNDICERTKAIDDPDYDLDKEAAETLVRVSQLTDEIKAEIEFFDNKFTSLLPLQVQQFFRMGIKSDDFQFILADKILVEAIREATIVVWRSKVEHDLVRPPSYIHEKYAGKTVYSYGGPKVKGNRMFDGAFWQPYKQVMPHSEFPSGSACICQAFAEAMIVLAGDDVVGLLGSPLEHPIPKHSSAREEGKPEQDLKLEYGSWTDVVERCRQTRIEGGMHFTASIDAGKTLCTGIGTTIANTFLQLETGQVPNNFVVDFNEDTIDEKRDCSNKRVRG